MDQPGYADFRARREATIWQRLNRILRLLLFVAGWLMVISLFVPPYKRMQAARAEIDALQAQVNEQKTILGRQTREVNGIDQNTKLNRALWTLAEEMKRLKTGA